LRHDYDAFTKRDTEILVLGPETSDSFRKYWQKEKLPFKGIPDPTHRILKLYGQEVSLFRLGRMPAQVIIDKNGRVRYVHYGHSMMDIPVNTEILSLLDSINSIPSP
jgi:peroxiredoxin Q/BCP